MSKAAKVWLIVAASLVLLGVLIVGGVMMFLKFDFGSFITSKCQTNTHEISEEFNSISVNTSTADISFLVSEDGGRRVVCYEQENLKHSVEVRDGTLFVSLVDTRKWYEHISIYSENPMVTVYLPKAEYAALTVRTSTGDVGISAELSFERIDINASTADVKCYASATGEVKIKTSTGDIFAEGLSAGSLDLSVTTGKVKVSSVSCSGDVKLESDTGDIELSGVSCKNIISEGETSDISLLNVIAKERFSIKTDTGDIKFDRCDASEMFIEADTGDVTGSFCSDKIFFAQSDTGRIDVPRTTSGGRCEITTDTGDIRLWVVQ